MTASWLRQMGWRDVFVLAAQRQRERRAGCAGARATRRRRNMRSTPRELSALVAKDHATVVDLSLSPAYRKGHIPGAWFAIRARLAQALAKIPVNGELVLTSEDGVLAGLAACRDAPCRRAICAAATPPGRTPA